MIHDEKASTRPNTLSHSGEATTAPGAAIYTSPLLKFYDWWVLSIVSTYAWRCSTRDILVPFFRAHVGPHRHLDIGVGTGYYLQHAGIPAAVSVSLVDLNPNSLVAATTRLGPRPEPTECILHDMTTPLDPVATAGPFDSISLFYLLHCMPGPTAAKAVVFEHLKPHLAPGASFTAPRSWVSDRASDTICSAG
ncbi:hypothetical protein MMC16_003267 [Acarospora aff. strigata]|nr:hypothetical protein [Acarospora aff. strigata]